MTSKHIKRTGLLWSTPNICNNMDYIGPRKSRKEKHLDRAAATHSSRPLLRPAHPSRALLPGLGSQEAFPHAAHGDVLQKGEQLPSGHGVGRIAAHAEDAWVSAEERGYGAGLGRFRREEGFPCMLRRQLLRSSDVDDTWIYEVIVCRMEASPDFTSRSHCRARLRGRQHAKASRPFT